MTLSKVSNVILIYEYSKSHKFQKLYDLYDQIFDYFNLTIYDLESKLDTNLNIKNFKNKLETFSDNHFKNALNEFNEEMSKLKDQIPEDFLKKLKIYQ